MAQARKADLNYRCPQCFMRDIDMDMFYDPEKKNIIVCAASFTVMRKQCWKKMKKSG